MANDGSVTDGAPRTEAGPSGTVAPSEGAASSDYYGSEYSRDIDGEYRDCKKKLKKLNNFKKSGLGYALPPYEKGAFDKGHKILTNRVESLKKERKQNK
jgi:hypothetical protein